MIIVLSLLVFPFFAVAQGYIDDLFRKYSGNENFTSIVISKNLLDFVFALDKHQDSKINKVKGKISDLKILISNNKSGLSPKFINEIKDNIDDDGFLTLIEIIDGNKKVNLYAKKDNDKIVHLLLLAKEVDQEVMLSLQGNFSMKELAELGRGTNIDGSFHHLTYLKDLEK